MFVHQEQLTCPYHSLAQMACRRLQLLKLCKHHLHILLEFCKYSVNVQHLHIFEYM